MTRQEIEKAIENGEDVWVIVKNHTTILPYKANLLIIEGVNDNGYIGNKALYKTTDLFETKAEAEHYLHHANITRTETLPFLTWEKFKSDMNFVFSDFNGTRIDVFIINGYIIMSNEYEQELFNEPCNYKSFFKLYDECVRLFKGEV